MPLALAWPPWLWFLLGGAVGAFAVTAALFVLDAYSHTACPTCGSLLRCDVCGHWPHHEFQGAPRGLQGIRGGRSDA